MRLGIAEWLSVSVLLAQGALAQENHSHPAPEVLGTVKFETSCAAGVVHDFERAVALLHSFAYESAEKAFRNVAAADPSCAMAHWGVAMTFYHQLWTAPDFSDLHKGQAEADQAIRLPVHSRREMQFIAAIAAYYRDYEHLPHVVRAQAYREAMQAAAKDSPRDIEAQVFFALSLIATAPVDDKSHAQQKRAALILEPIYRNYPDHPGVAHYLIHDYDNTELASRGLPAARAYSKIAPSAPHALHMPSHIFTRLGLWEDSIASNLAARAAAHSQGDVGEELHAMDYLVYAYLQRDRPEDARRVVADLRLMSNLMGNDFKVGYAATAMPVRLAMERQDWNAATDLGVLPDSVPHVAAIVYWARAVAAARAGHPRDGEQDIELLKSCRLRLKDSSEAYWSTQVDVLIDEAEAWHVDSLHIGNPLQLMGRAADQEDSVEKLPVTPGPVIPAREQLGDMLLAHGRPQEALNQYRTALRGAPGRRGALLGAARAIELARASSAKPEPSS